MKSQLEDILNRVHSGSLTPAQAMKALKDYPYQDLDFAKVDHHRELRKGFPEVIYGLGKTDDQIVKIARAIVKKGSSLLVTRVGAGTYAKLRRAVPGTKYNALARPLFSGKDPLLPARAKSSS